MSELGVVLKWLSTVQVKELAPASRGLYTVPDTEKLLSVLRILSTHKLTAIPVVKGGKISGFVDNVDILQYFCQHLDIVDKIDSWSSVDMESSVVNVPIGSMVNLAKGDAFVSVGSETPVAELMKFFISRLSHRSIVHYGKTTEDSKAEAEVVCSQSDVVRFLNDALASKKHPELAILDDKKIEPHLAKRPLVTISAEATIVEVVRIMSKNNVTCVGIVEPASGKLVADFAASDLRGIEKIDSKLLNLNSIAFLKEKRPSHLEPCLGFVDSTIKSLIHQASTFKVHRVWIVDADHKPLDVITLTDILRIVSKF